MVDDTPLIINHVPALCDKNNSRSRKFSKALKNALVVGSKRRLWKCNNIAARSHKKNISAKPRNNIFHISWHTRSNRRDIINWKASHICGNFYFDDMGHSKWSSIRDDFNPNVIYPKPNSLALNNNITKYDQPNIELNLENHVFIPMQVFGDPVTKCARFTYEEIIQKLLDNDVNIVIKKHPRDKCKIYKNLRSKYKPEISDGKIVLYPGDICNAINKAAAIIVINSAVGCESLLAHKNVILLGDSDYEAACYKLHDINDLIYAINRPVDVDLIDSFISFYLLRTICVDDPKIEETLINLISNKVRFGTIWPKLL